MSKNSTYLRVAKRNKKSNDMAKLQIKSEKPLFLEDFFRVVEQIRWHWHWQSKIPQLPFEGKGVKEKVYIYIYKYKNILLTFLYFSIPFTEERRGVRKIGLSVSVSAKRHIKSEVVRNYDFGRRKLNLCAPKAMDFRRVNLLNAFLLKIASLRTPKFGGFKK